MIMNDMNKDDKDVGIPVGKQSNAATGHYGMDKSCPHHGAIPPVTVSQSGVQVNEQEKHRTETDCIGFKRNCMREESLTCHDLTVPSIKSCYL